MFNIIDKIKEIKLPFLSNFQLYVDFGTSFTRIAIKDKGVVLNEPTILGLNSKTNEFLFFGSEAKKIIGKVPEFIKIIKPIVNGTISDFDAQLALTKRLVEEGRISILNEKWYDWAENSEREISQTQKAEPSRHRYFYLWRRDA